MILSPLEIEWKKNALRNHHYWTFGGGINSFLSPLELDKKFHPTKGKSSTGALRQGCPSLTPTFAM